MPTTYRYGLLACIAAAAAVPSIARAPTLAVLAGLEPGQWQLHERGDGARGDGSGPTISVCTADPARLLVLHEAHRAAACAVSNLDDEPTMGAVRYVCRGVGHGRTVVRRETARLAQIDTQGFANGAPFSLAFEGRRTGPCS